MKEKKIGILGTGLMGYPIAERLISKGYRVGVYNRTKKKAEGLVKVGAEFLEPEKLAAFSDFLIVILSDYTAISETLLSVSGSALKGTTVIQMSTVAVEESIKASEFVNGNGGNYVEAPVLGSIPQIKEGKLITMVGGDKSDFEKVTPLLEELSEKIVFVGKVGKAAALKLALNQLIASLTAAFSASLGLVRENNVSVDLFMDILRSSALYAPTFDKKLNRMLDGNFENPNFPLKHLLKDINLILNENEKAGIKSEALEGVKQIVERGLNMGFDEKDYSSLYNAVHLKK